MRLRLTHLPCIFKLTEHWCQGLEACGQQFAPDHRQYSVGILENFVVPEPQHFKAFTLQPPVSDLVFVFLKSVLPTVKFNDESLLETYKTHNVWTERLLTAEFAAFQLS